jgi:formate hydrogenlyase transcriptional activator
MAGVNNAVQLSALWPITRTTSLGEKGWFGTSLSMENDRTDDTFQDIVGDSPGLKRVLKLAMKVAPGDTPVLILGEGGSGKELIARAIHRIGVRRNESFVKVNCAEPGAGILESKLFGHARDAKGNAGRTGHLESADNGIIFLDEIAHIPLSIQTKLLRLLERREFGKPGSMDSTRVNVRLIASTKYDLGEGIAEQMFREDLYEQLNVFPIRVPPLRERRDDIPLLTRYFVRKFARRTNKRIENIPEQTLRLLMNYDWPGNITQLEDLIERSVTLTQGSALQVPTAGLQPEPEAEAG